MEGVKMSAKKYFHENFHFAKCIAENAEQVYGEKFQITRADGGYYVQNASRALLSEEKPKAVNEEKPKTEGVKMDEKINIKMWELRKKNRINLSKEIELIFFKEESEKWDNFQSLKSAIIKRIVKLIANNYRRRQYK